MGLHVRVSLVRLNCLLILIKISLRGVAVFLKLYLCVCDEDVLVLGGTLHVVVLVVLIPIKVLELLIRALVVGVLAEFYIGASSHLSHVLLGILPWILRLEVSKLLILLLLFKQVSFRKSGASPTRRSRMRFQFFIGPNVAIIWVVVISVCILQHMRVLITRVLLIRWLHLVKGRGSRLHKNSVLAKVLVTITSATANTCIHIALLAH